MEGGPLELRFHVCVTNEISEPSSFDIEDLAFSFDLYGVQLRREEKKVLSRL